jgi:type I restriction enzyme S subunit
MKEGWAYKKLGEIAIDMYRGAGIRREQITASGYPCIRYGEIYTTYNIAFENCISHTVEDNISPRKYFEYGDLLFAITGESVEDIGKTIAYLGHEKCLLGGDIVCMKHNENPKYLSYALSSREAIRQKGLGKTKLKVVHTNIPSLKEIIIPIPPLSEQQSIVAYLDSAFAKIDAMKANAEKALNEAKALFQASLKEMLEPKESWEKKALGEITVFSQGIQVDVNLQTEICSPGKVRFLRIIDVTQGNVPPRYIDDPGERYYLKADEIAMVRYGTVGFVCYGFEGVIANNLFKVSIKDKSKLQSSYLQYYLKSDLFQSHIRKGVGGAALPAIKFGDIKHIILGFPSLSEQQSIVNTLDSLKSKVDRLQSNFDKISQECDALKQAILRQVFE